METLIITIITTIISYLGLLINILILYKDAANKGYKINSNLSKINKYLNNQKTTIDTFKLFIPFFNLYTVINKILEYLNKRNHFLDKLQLIGLLKEFSFYENQEYQKNPNIINAIIIPIKFKKLSEKSKSAKLDNNNEIEYFLKGELNIDNITILKVKGSISKLSEEEIKIKLLIHLENTLRNLIDNLSDESIQIRQIAKVLKQEFNKNYTKNDLEKLKEIRRYLVEMKNSKQSFMKGNTIKELKYVEYIDEDNCIICQLLKPTSLLKIKKENLKIIGGIGPLSNLPKEKQLEIIIRKYNDFLQTGSQMYKQGKTKKEIEEYILNFQPLIPSYYEKFINTSKKKKLKRK